MRLLGYASSGTSGPLDHNGRARIQAHRRRSRSGLHKPCTLLTPGDSRMRHRVYWYALNPDTETSLPPLRSSAALISWLLIAVLRVPNG